MCSNVPCLGLIAPQPDAAELSPLSKAFWVLLRKTEVLSCQSIELTTQTENRAILALSLPPSRVYRIRTTRYARYARVAELLRSKPSRTALGIIENVLSSSEVSNTVGTCVDGYIFRVGGGTEGGGSPHPNTYTHTLNVRFKVVTFHRYNSAEIAHVEMYKVQDLWVILTILRRNTILCLMN